MTDRNQHGAVYLVGAGPGDPGLITVKGLRLLESADVVVCDRLVDERLVSQARGGAEVVRVGKRPGREGITQDAINAILIEKAKEGKSVVRLKGGDPFIFGRGGEEAEALAQAGVPFEVVPGVTSAIAAPAYAGIPLTQRGYASSVTIATGSEAPDKPGSDVAWDKVAPAGGTLVVLMGFDSLGPIVAALRNGGRAPETPVALVHWGTEPYQRTVVGTLADIDRQAKAAGIAPPVVVVVGEVVRLRDKLRWFDNRPLSGKRVLVTRTRAQAGTLSELLTAAGAHAIEVPTIEVRPLEDYRELDGTLAAMADYDWVVFASTNAVEAVWDRMVELGKDARAFHGTSVAAVGPRTDAALRERGIVPDFVPERFVSEEIVDGLGRMGMTGKTVLLPRSDIGREALPAGLARLGADVIQVAAYRNVAPDGLAERLDRVLDDGVDVATFTSSSTVRNLTAMLKGGAARLENTMIACIGPITAAAARDVGLTVGIEASEYTIEGLVAAVADYYASEVSVDG